MIRRTAFVTSLAALVWSSPPALAQRVDCVELKFSNASRFDCTDGTAGYTIGKDTLSISRPKPGGGETVYRRYGRDRLVIEDEKGRTTSTCTKIGSTWSCR